MDPENRLLFSSIVLVATITPGPAALLVTSHSFGYGVKSTIATILGNISGLFGARTGAGIRNSRFEKAISRVFGSIFIGSGVILGTTQ